MLRVWDLLRAEALHIEEEVKALDDELRVCDVHLKFCLALRILAYFSVDERRPCYQKFA